MPKQMSNEEILEYLEHKSSLSNPTPNRFKREAKEFLLNYKDKNKIPTDDLKILFYMWANNLKEIPKCQYPNCDKPSRFLKYSEGFSKGCCHEHAVKVANLEKYGVEKPFQSKEIQNKVKKTFNEKYGDWITKTEKYKEIMKERYGSYHPMKSKEIKDKLKDTLIKKYGGIGASSEIIKEKMKETNLKKYGVETIFQLKEIKEKAHKKLKEKYGSKCPLNNIEVKEKAKNSLMRNYGVDNPAKFKKVQEKIKETNLRKYGVEYPMRNDEVKKKVISTLLKKTFDKKREKCKEYGIEFLFDINDYIGTKNVKYKFKCLKCGHVFKFSLVNGRFPICPVCNPKKFFNKSQMEIELFNSINYSNKIQSDRSILDGLELDIVIPDKKIAIEFNVLFWHSEIGGGKDKDYHFNKTKLAQEKGYQLIHIFEDEWLFKRDIVLSLIHSKLGIFDKRIYARNCEIKELNSNEANEFFDENHLQGADNSKVRLGLFYQNELVSVMTFSKPRFNKKYEWELVRFASKLNYQIIGGASKLLKYFLNYYNPSSIITYADRRYSNGNLYRRLGFEFDGFTSPNFYILKDYIIRENRIKFQKHKLKDKLINFDPDLSAWENMQLNGYDRIWDCGNYRFVWRNNENY